MSAALVSSHEAAEARQRDLEAPNHNARKRTEAQARIDITQPLALQPAYLRFADVAALLGKSIRTISSWEQKGLVRVLRPAGGTPLLEKSEVERLLREGGAQ